MSVTMQEGVARLYYRAVKFGSLDPAPVVLGGGTSGNPISTATADKNLLAWYTQSTATSGSSRGHYLRHYLAGAGNDGECLRAFTTVSDVAAANAKGAHISLSFASTGSITGEGLAVRATLQLPNATMAGGTYAANEAELWSDGSSTAVAGVTALSLFRAVISGNATGVGRVDDKASLISLVGNTIGAGNIMATQTSAAVSHTLRMDVNGATYYLMVSTNQ